MKIGNKKRLFWLEFFGFCASVLPLLTFLTLNWDRYVKNDAAGVKLAAGGVIVGILLLFKTLGKLKLPGSVTVVTAVMLLSYLLQPVLSDLTRLSGAYLLGEVTDLTFFRRRARVLREKIAADRAADATATRMEELLKTYVENGRMRE